jgi:hypothetical protein
MNPKTLFALLKGGLLLRDNSGNQTQYLTTINPLNPITFCVINQNITNTHSTYKLIQILLAGNVPSIPSIALIYEEDLQYHLKYGRIIPKLAF